MLQVYNSLYKLLNVGMWLKNEIKWFLKNAIFWLKKKKKQKNLYYALVLVGKTQFQKHHTKPPVSE